MTAVSVKYVRSFLWSAGRVLRTVLRPAHALGCYTSHHKAMVSAPRRHQGKTSGEADGSGCRALQGEEEEEEEEKELMGRVKGLHTHTFIYQRLSPRHVLS
ncbi:hypothetical protein E2C01_026445 [Portunus trituberculatus]|uniref:Uncharacterized protein n=1 Tax=Portunus trituberculatus TaxID=210409 RepID=A0A5B7EJ72_PORTR|nr:hypothetical protein [Portunus trituberculatus]